MIISIVQMNSVIGDFEGNANKIVSYVNKACSRKSALPPPELVIFPEMALCGYPPMDLLDYDSFAEGSLAGLRKLQKELPSSVAVGVGYVDRNRSGSGRALINAFSVIAEGKIVFTQLKTLLPTYDVFDEARYFEPAKVRKVFTPQQARIGFAICEDFWWEAPPSPDFRYPIDPVKELLDSSIDILIVPSASPFIASKLKTRLRLARNTAREGHIPVLYCNSTGANDSLVFDGRSFAVDSKGDMIGMCGWEDEILTIDTTSMTAENLVLAQTARVQHLETILAREQPSGEPVPATVQNPVNQNEIEEIHQALIVGIKDYLDKTGFSKVCLGLSGGIDSALVAVLAAEAVGADNVVCIAMPSRFSSEGSMNDAIELCRRNRIHLEKLPIEVPFTAFLSQLAVPFAGRPFDSAEENLQARIRGCYLMAWSNKFNSILLTTGNKSELATGYCTLYGDMCGALAPIADLYKTEVYALSRHINALARQAGKMDPIPEAIILKAPSAELRLNQKDQDSLPEYEILDKILVHYIENNKAFDEIVELGFDTALVRKVLLMTARAEFKRRQAAPAIKVSRRAFGIGRRLPLARAIYEADSI